MAENAGGFFYTLDIQSNLNSVNKQMGSFFSNTTKVAGALAGVVGASKLVANQYRDLNALSTKTLESVGFIRQIQNEFKLLGFSAEEGSGLVEGLAGQIKEFQTFGTGNLESFARLGINIQDIKNTEQFIQALRQSAQKDLETFVTVSPKIGISNAQIQLLTQADDVFTKNRQIAKEQSIALENTIDSQKKLNIATGELSIAFNKLNRFLLPLGEESAKVLTAFLGIGEDIAKKVNVNEQAKSITKSSKEGVIGFLDFITQFDRPKKTSEIEVESKSIQERLFNSGFGQAYRGLVAESMNVKSIGMDNIATESSTSNTSSSTSNVVNNRNNININVATAQEANELRVYNEARGGL